MTHKKPSISIIGAGISGMVASCYLQKKGYQVTVYEKNLEPGGRVRNFTNKGFTFDMGPSWYWMPEVFEQFFSDFGKKISNYYELIRLEPSYSVYFNDGKFEVPSSIEGLGEKFEKLEPGSAGRLRYYIKDAREKYEIGMHRFALKPALRFDEFLSKDIYTLLRRLQPLRNMEQHVNRYFEHPKIRRIMQFPVIFLGAMPQKIPAMYSLMNYADIVLGTWYPRGGMSRIVSAIYALALELGVTFRFNVDIDHIEVSLGKANYLNSYDERLSTDLVIGAGDYHHIEQLLPVNYQQYSEQYWESRSMAPSCLLYYIGINKRLDLNHHNLFFDTDFENHASSLYKNPSWPEKPLFYACAPSVSDPSVAPSGCENLFLLVPIAAGLKGDDPSLRAKYFKHLMSRLEHHLKTDITDHVIYYKDYSIQEFITDYHAYLGNAYGLANTLKQTAFGKPRLRSKKVENLFYCGQLTVPGPGLPPSILSGKMVAEQADQYLAKQKGVIIS